MEKYLDKKQSTALSKSDVAAYVHDMKELELKQFTLKKLQSQCNEERYRTENNSNQTIKNATDWCEKAKEDFQTAKHNLDEATKSRIPKPKDANQTLKKPQKPEEPRKPWGPIPWKYIYLLFIPFTIPFGIIIIIFNIRYKKKYREYQEKYLKYQKRYQEYQTEYLKYEQYLSWEKQEKTIEDFSKPYNYCHTRYIEAQKNFIDAEKYSKAAQEKIKKLDRISLFLAQKISDIENRKLSLYDLNIVPPDYRRLDCLIEFDQMYRNDLVDTMREAVKIYEERVFRGELLTGIDNIYNMLGNLTSAMHNIESALYSVRNEVVRMGDDINQIASSGKKFQDDMISESQAARYATEALYQTQERCEWYLKHTYRKI